MVGGLPVDVSLRRRRKTETRQTKLFCRVDIWRSPRDEGGRDQRKNLEVQSVVLGVEPGQGLSEGLRQPTTVGKPGKILPGCFVWYYLSTNFGPKFF